MAAEKDLKEIIKEAAAEPQSASIDGQTIQQRPLSDLIAAAKFAARSRSIPATPAPESAFTSRRGTARYEHSCWNSPILDRAPAGGS